LIANLQWLGWQRDFGVGELFIEEDATQAQPFFSPPNSLGAVDNFFFYFIFYFLFAVLLREERTNPGSSETILGPRHLCGWLTRTSHTNTKKNLLFWI
jgi:hypothetical protein